MTMLVMDIAPATMNEPKQKTAILPAFKVSVHIDTEVMDPEAARRKANVWLLLHAGHLLRADNPQLILEDETLFWRYDVMLTQIGHGVVGKIADIVLDAKTGEVTTDPGIRDEWLTTAQLLLRKHGLPLTTDHDSERAR